MENIKQFPFERARRISSQEISQARKAIEQVTGKNRPMRGRPPKNLSEKFKAISIRLHPKILTWAKKRAKELGVGYQTVINNYLLKKIA